MADLFQRCREYTIIDDAKALGVYPYFHEIEESSGTEVVIAGKRAIMLGSNNYLGLTTDPRVRQAATDAIFEGLSWLGLDWDGDPISQRSRQDDHRKAAEDMLARGTAYKCFATQDEIEAARAAARESGCRWRPAHRRSTQLRPRRRARWRGRLRSMHV